MNIAYYRKSSYDRQTTIRKIKENAQELGLDFIGMTDLPGGNGTVVYISNPNWLGNLIAADANMIGFLPFAVAVISKKDDTLIGIGDPAVLRSISKNPAIMQLAIQTEGKMKDLVHKSAGVGPLKPRNVKLYSTTTCPYCKMEAAWLREKKITFEEVHVDFNQTAAEEMVAKTGQMGVPVTAISYEDSYEDFIVGFDKPQLSQILSINN